MTATPSSSATCSGAAAAGSLPARGRVPRAARRAHAAIRRTPGSAIAAIRSRRSRRRSVPAPRPRSVALCTSTQYGQVLPRDTAAATASLAARLTVPSASSDSRSISQQAARDPGRGRVQDHRRGEHAEVPFDLPVDSGDESRAAAWP